MKRLACCLLLAIAACAYAAFEPPRDAPVWCSGHVTGAPSPDGKPGMHITWTAYTSTESQQAVAKRYLRTLDPKQHSREGECDLWRDPPDEPKKVLEVCPISENGPWSGCKDRPARARTVIMISSR